MDDFPRSIAIAGAWGYIGRKILDAALDLGLEVHALDPGPLPDDLDPGRVAVHRDEVEFYQLDADLFHLALHPEHRRGALEALLARGAEEPLLILNEKPMARPEQPEQCRAVIRAVEKTRAVMLFDFLELFDPMTHAVIRHLSRFDRVELTDISLYRGKDREDPDRPRNYKKMVHIQFQESVHCLAFLLNLLGSLRGSLEQVFADGLAITARALPYEPPNPQDYPYVVDGQCHYEMALGELKVRGITDFKRGAELAKRKILRGRVDGRPFIIETDSLEGRKHLRIDGVDQGLAPDAGSYRHAIITLGSWYRNTVHEQLRQGIFPHPRFARLTYQLSSVLWKSCWIGETITLDSCEELIGFAAGFAEAAERFPRYRPSC